MVKAKHTPYSKGKRWGYAVARASIQTSKSNVHKVDKAMQTCARNARMGTRKLNKNERNAYRGMADGIYEAIIQSERGFSTKKKTPGAKKKISKNKPFQYNYQTRVKGSYTVDGRFEPD